MQAELDRVSEADISRIIDPSRPEWRHVFSISPFVANYLSRHSGMSSGLKKEALLHFNIAQQLGEIKNQLASITDDIKFDRQLRISRNETMALIAIRDLQGLATLAETLEQLSSLADILVKVCLQWKYEKLARRYGHPRTDDDQPMPLVVLAMGKLGAKELNFSSDIDLILAYENEGVTDGSLPIEHHEFFLKLAQQLHQSLNKITQDGFVFRVDLRLRPYGDSGPLVMSFDAMEEYYQTQGREWERYAMIKVRAIGMDEQAGERLLTRLQSFVYRRYLDFNVIQSLRDLKSMIDRETNKKNRQDDLKLGPGGIREVEFIAQVFQLIRGGKDIALRSRSTPLVLSWLAEREHISEPESEVLIAAWRFLRETENHIQMMYDRQEHALPLSAIDRQRLSLSMGFNEWPAFIEQLSLHRKNVQECFDNIIINKNRSIGISDKQLFWLDITDEVAGERHLTGLKFAQPLDMLRRIQVLKTRGIYRRLSARGQELMDKLMPTVIDLAAATDSPDETLLRLLSVITAIAQRESYLALLVEVPSARQQLTRLCSASSWITQVISRHPVLLDELIDPERLYVAPDKGEINMALARLLASLDFDDVENQMEGLRIFKQAQQLRIAAADITQTLPLMRVSDSLTWLAEGLLNITLELAWTYLINRYGRPVYELHGEQLAADFAVIGFGKLGGCELGYGSDLDLVFVHDSQGSFQMTDGEKSLENDQFFTRLAQRLVHLLSTLTPSGVLYDIDTRLRPNGQSGLLVTSLDAFASYQQEEAWTWEHQALVRARPIAGNVRVCRAFQQIREEVLSTPRDQKKLANEILEMRQRMRMELDRSNAEEFNLKQGVGGIVDIEFMVQYAVLGGASRYPGMLKYTDNTRLAKAASETDLITTEQARILIVTYQDYRARLHHQVLQGLGDCVRPPEFKEQREQVTAIWQQLFENV